RLGGAGLRGNIGTASAQLSGFSIESQQPGAPFFVTGKVAAERIDLLLPQATPVGIGAERVEIDLAKTRLAFPPGRGAQIEGGVVLDTRNLSVSVEGGAAPGRKPPPPTRIGAGRLVFQLPALAFDDTGGGGPSLNAREPLLNVDELRLDGPVVRGSVDRAAVRLRDVNVAGAGAPLTGSGTLTMDRLDLLVPGVEPITFAAGHVQVDLVETRVALSPGQPPLAGGLVLELRDVLGTLQEIGRRGNPPPPLTTAEMARLTATVPAVTAARPYATAGSIGVAGPIVRMDRLRLGGADIQGTVRSADVRFDDIGVETAVPGPPVVATGKIMARDLDLVIPDLDPIGIVAREFNADLSRTRYAFPSQRVLIDGDFGLDMKDFALRLYQHPPEGKPAAAPTRISASRFAGKLPRLVIAERRRTSLKINVASPGLTFDGFGMEAAAGSDALVRLASSKLALQRAEVDFDDGRTTMAVAVQAGVTAPDLSVVMVPQNGSTGARAQIGGLDVDLRRVAYRREGEAKGVGLQGRIGMGSMQGTLPPRQPGEAADRLALTGLKLDLADVDLTTGGDRPAWRARLDLALKSLAA
ncbi:MAG TPA: hypothetical protein VES39_12590, partial [Rhodospirillales bacterium]|nr:hypothetical protein [Rhodospirillales bacterium]